MVDFVSRSPFEYYPTVAPTGGGIAKAFQEGQATFEGLERERAATERVRTLLPLEAQQYGTIDAMRRQQMGIEQAKEGRTVADFNRLLEADAERRRMLQPGAAVTPPAGASFIGSERAQALRTQLMPTWQGLEQSYNLPAGYLDRTAAIESGYNPTAQREGSQYAGMFQIGPDAASDLRLPLDARTDPVRSSEAAAQFAARNAQTLQRALGRQPAGWEIYLAHQQGAGGATALLTNAQQPALNVLTSVYGGNRERATQAIVQNGGNLTMTAGQFASLWQNKFGGGAATPPAPGRAVPDLPPGALGEGFITQSSGGVPMTRPDLPAPGAGDSQFVVPGPTGMTPVGVPLDAQGRPVGQPATTDQRAARIAAIDSELSAMFEPGTSAGLVRATGAIAGPIKNAINSVTGSEQKNLDSYAYSLIQERSRLTNELETERRFSGTQAIAEDAARRLQSGDYAGATGRVVGGALGQYGERGMNILRGLGGAAESVYRFGAGVVGANAPGAAPVAPTAAPSVGLSQPIPTMLGGATGIAPAGLTPPMGGGTLMPGALSPTPMSAQPQGLLAQRPAAPAATAGGARTDTVVADATKLPPRYGVFDRAEVARQRETLNSQMQFIEAELRYAIATRASTETVSQLNSARVAAQNKSDMLSGMEAVSSLDAGDPRPIAEYFYRRTGGRLRMQQNADNSFNILDGDQITQRNMSKDELARYARSDVDYRVRAAAEEQKKVQAERAKEFYKTQLDIFKEVSQQEAIGTRDQALEKVKAAIKARTGQDPKMEIQNDKVYIFDPNNKRVSVGQFVNTDVTGRRLPQGQTRLQFDAGAYGTVLTQ